MTTILRIIFFFLLAPALAITTQAAGVDQGDFRVNDKGFRVASGLLMVNSAIYAAHGEYIEAGFSALGSVGSGWAAARTATGSVAGLSSAYTTPKWHQGSVSASESVATSLSSTRFSGGATNKLDDVARTNFNQYEAIFEAPISGTSRGAHRTSANNFLANQLDNSPDLQRMFNNEFGTDVLQHMNSGSGRNFLNPPGTQWHHPVGNPGVMELLRTGEHTNPLLQPVLHPKNIGGYGTFYGP